MNKGVLISIQPKWCAKIASGHKTIEIRKTKPVMAPPFKVYIYCTKPDTTDPHEHLETHSGEHIYTCNGKVFAEFVCREIDRIGKRGINNNFDYCYLSLNEFGNDDIEVEIRDIQKSRIPKKELNSYGANSPHLYAWHISDLVIYDKPRDLSEFYLPCKEYSKDVALCGDCPYYSWANNESYHYEECAVEGMKPIKRPPQSWCYAEEVPKRTNTGEPDGDLPLFC